MQGCGQTMPDSQRRYIEEGDIEEAMNAAAKIGDDALQKQSQGYVVPDSFTHGTSAQRMKWFNHRFCKWRHQLLRYLQCSGSVII